MRLIKNWSIGMQQIGQSTLDYQNYTPPKPEDYNETDQGRTIMSVPENHTIQNNNFEALPPEEDKYKGRRFRWIYGDDEGDDVTVEVTFKRKDKYYVLLNTGQELSLQELTQQLVEIDELEVIRPNEYNKKNGLVENNNNQNLNQQSNNTPVSNNTVNNDFHPVTEILKKKKPNPKKINIELELDFPPKELYSILIDSYDDGEDKIIEYIFSSGNFDMIKKSIKNSIRKYYGIEQIKEEEEIIEDNENKEVKEKK